MELPVVLRQAALAKLPNERLSAHLADHVIALAFRLGKTPQEVLLLAADNVGFDEKEWEEEVEPRLRRWLNDPDFSDFVGARQTRMVDSDHAIEWRDLGGVSEGGISG